MYKKGQPSTKISPKAHKPLNHHDYIRLFADVVQSHTGASPEIVADGAIHRFDDPQGKSRNYACWYVMHLSATPYGAIGNWRTGQQWRWTGYDLSETSSLLRVQIDEIMESERKERELNQKAGWERAKLVASELWMHSGHAKADHPYLVRKQVPPLNLRARNRALLAPMIDTDGQLWNVQSIDQNGAKRFQKGARIKGMYSLVGASVLPTDGRLYICEGIATAHTLYMESKAPVAAAMNCGNLKPVTLEIRRARPYLELIIAADNDRRTPGNPGMTKAEDAARSVNCGIVWPRSFCEECSCTDFNDVALCRDREVAA